MMEMNEYEYESFDESFDESYEGEEYESFESFEAYFDSLKERMMKIIDEMKRLLED